MLNAIRVLRAVFLLTLVVLPEAKGQEANEGQRVSEVLDALHTAASQANFDRYFELYAREAIFLGTDATERWTRAEFMGYTKTRFETGTGWTYEVLERHVYIASGAKTAWFDERLENEGLGETRGSGVLLKENGEWKVAQYNLTIPIPNELSRDVVRQIRALVDGI